MKSALSVSLTISDCNKITAALQRRRKALQNEFNPGCLACRIHARKSYKTTLSALKSVSRQVSTEAPPRARLHPEQHLSLLLSTDERREVMAALTGIMIDIKKELDESCPRCPNTPGLEYIRLDDLLLTIAKAV